MIDILRASDRLFARHLRCTQTIYLPRWSAENRTLGPFPLRDLIHPKC